MQQAGVQELERDQPPQLQPVERGAGGEVTVKIERRKDDPHAGGGDFDEHAHLHEQPVDRVDGDVADDEERRDRRPTEPVERAGSAAARLVLKIGFIGAHHRGESRDVTRRRQTG